MKSNKSFLFLTLMTALSLSSCYHLKFGGGGSGGGTGGGGNSGGNSLMNITVTSTPSQTFSFVSFNLQIVGVAVTETAGTGLTVISDTGLPGAELVNDQVESHYLGASNIAPGPYKNVIINFNQPNAFFYNSSSASVLGCAPATVCQVPVGTPGFSGGSITIPFTFTAISGINMGLDINIDLSKALTTTNGMTFDVGLTGAVTVSLLPRTGQISGSLDSLENYTGVVSATTATTMTVAPFASVGEPRTFTVPTNATFNDPFAICPPPARFSCVAADQNVSVDGVINADGTFAAYEVDFIDPAPFVKEIEGIVIAPPSSNQFQMLITNIMGGFLNGNQPASPGRIVTISMTSNASFFADPKNLGISTTPIGFLSQADIVQGQTIMIRALTQTGLFPNVTITSDRAILRYSRMGGTVTTAPSGAIFNLTNISPFYINVLNNTSPVQTFQNATIFDGFTSLSALSPPANVSIRALYLNPNSGATPPLLAAKVRAH